ncbi:integrin beta-nu [Plodia interpunctella]|uniref:integrin beta-nu n=1 Tax=Plodia interpunctella TaxID=58824 RepID=UPI0023677CDD|nr:integrin beta-nu [Plodia interpunctella]
MTELCYAKLSVFIVLLLVLDVGGQAQQQLFNKLVCIEKEECGACLTAASHCRWCADPYFDNRVPRCNDDESLVAAGCGQGMIQRPLSPLWETVESRPLQDMQADSVEDVVQIQPQKLRLSLKPRETKKIKFKYRPAKNYPLDLYYLMDLTWSMKDDKKTLVSLGDDLLAMLKNLTDNFRLGFGSFADKPMMPYAYMDPNRLKNPCALEDQSCEMTYSYRHHLSLTTEVNDFIEKVNKSSVTANLDNAEAQLEALVQTVACDVIGWEPRSRKIVILLSDGLMHTAGDGKISGSVRRNDEACHLDENGYYSEAPTYDYPSIAQVYRLLDEYKVNVIFAVTNDVKIHYDQLHELLKDFTYVAKLESDSSNILKLVKMGYEDFVSVVDFEDNSNLGPIKIKYFSDCGEPGGPLVETTRCTGVEYGMTLNYEAYLTLESCTDFKMYYEDILISESQLGQDTLSLEVQIQCGCNCSGDQLKDMALSCPLNSHPVCGVCQCDNGWSGPKCTCSIADDTASTELMMQCRAPNSTRSCSGAGDCLCGKCQCDPGFQGRYCQCQTCEVSTENGLECGGEDRGSCACGECVCADHWGGVACDCALSNETCIAPGSKEVCSGHGTCECGQCLCGLTDASPPSRYSGAYCETCASCQNPLCATSQPCVSCHLEQGCDRPCSIASGNYTVVENYNTTGAIKSTDISCIFRIDDCEYRYTYAAASKDSIDMEIIIRSKECSQISRARIMNVGFAIMLCIVVAGIVVILIVKSLQIVSDRRAYAQFVKEAEMSRLDQQELNPIYKSPISQFTMPEGYPRDKME